MTLATAFAPSISNVSMHKITTSLFVSRLVGLAAKGSKSAAARRAKSAMLPEIQSCQSDIFDQLRLREGLRGATPRQPAQIHTPTLAEGLRLRLGQFFTADRTVH